jgi:hypothetical protein
LFKVGAEPAKTLFKMGHRGDVSKNQSGTPAIGTELFVNAVSFDAPIVKILYKNVAPENLGDKAFLDC